MFYKQVESDKFDTNIHATYQEDINYIMQDGYEVDGYQQPAPENKQTNIGYTDQQIYKY